MTEDQKPKHYIVDAKVTIDVVANYIKDAVAKIKEGCGEVITRKTTAPSRWTRGVVVFQCDKCEGRLCIVLVEDVSRPIAVPTLCPYYANFSTSFQGPYSGCYR